MKTASTFSRSWQKRIALVLILALLINAKGADKSAARTEWMGGFVKMEAADKAADNAVAAIDLYKAALETFENVRRKYPDWNPSLLNYRINYCQERISELSRKMENAANKLSPEELLELMKRQAKELQTLEASKKELSDRVAFLTDALQRARQEAASNSSLETAAKTLSNEKTSLEQKIATLELKLKNAEDKLKQLTAENANVSKLQQRADKAQKQLELRENELKVANAEVEKVKRDIELFKRENKMLSHQKENLDAALKAANEIVELRKNDLERLSKNLKSSEEKLKQRERDIAERERDLANLRKQLSESQNDNVELKRLRKIDAITIDDFKRGQEVSTAVAKENANIRKELDKAKQRIEELMADIKKLNIVQDTLMKKYEQEHAIALTKDEKNQELSAMVSKLKNKIDLAEKQNLKLNAELRESKIVLGKQQNLNSEIDNQLKSIEKNQKEISDLENRLRIQTELASKQEKEIARLTEQLGKNDKSLVTANTNNEQLKAQIATLEDDCRKLKLEIEEIRKIKHEKEEEAKKYKLDNDKYQAELELAKKESEELKKLRAKLAELEAEIANCTRTINEKISSNKKLNEEYETALRELADQKKKYGDLQTLLDKVRADYEKTFNNIDQRLVAGKNEIKEEMAKTSKLQFEAEQLRNALKNAEDISKKEREIFAAEKKKLEENAAKLVNEKTLLDNEKSLLDNELKKLRLEIDELNKSKDLLGKDLEIAKSDLKVAKAMADAQTGMVKNMADLEAKIAFLEKEIQNMKTEKESLISKHDKIVRSMIAHEDELKKQLASKDKEIEMRASEAGDNAWAQKLQRISDLLKKESQKRMALETALIELEDKLKAQNKIIQNAATSQTSPKPIGTSANTQTAIASTSNASTSTDAIISVPAASEVTSAQDANVRISRENERKSVIKGFLRQGTEAERQQKMEAARFNYNKVLEFDPDNALALQRLGIISFKTGNNKEAAKYLKQAFKFDPDNTDTLLALGYSLARSGEANWAISYLSRAVALNPDSAYASGAYGSVLLNIGWTQAAEVQLKKTFDMNPKDSEVPFNLTLLYLTSDPPNYADAKKWYEIAIKNGAQPDPGIENTLAQ